MKVEAVTHESAYAKCDYHVGNHPTIAINLTGPYEGKWFCLSCRRKGVIPERELQQLKKKAAMKSPIPIKDWKFDGCWNG